METRTEYIVRNKKEIEAEGIFFSDTMAETFSSEYYEKIIVKHIKAGGMISNEVYKDLTDGQKYHFNKFLNWDNDKVINSDYEQEIKRLKKISDEKHKIYLQEQVEKQRGEEIREQKEKEQARQQLTQEIEQLKSNLFDYDMLSAKGKRNITKYDHERKQAGIKEKIMELEREIKNII